MIRSKVPTAEIIGEIGRRTSFEVAINDQEIHSKLSTNSFPDFDEVTEIVESVEQGSSPRKVIKTNSGGCIVM